MNKLKDKLMIGTGCALREIWGIVGTVLTFAPIFFVIGDRLITDIILVLLTCLPLVGGIVELVIWIWSFVVAINMPFDFGLLVYYIALAIFVITRFLPAVLSILPYDGRRG